MLIDICNIKTICVLSNKMRGRRNVKLYFLYMIDVINLKDCYNWKIFYVIAMAATKKISKEYTQRQMRRKSKHVTTKRSTKHKDSKRRCKKS